MTEEFAKWLASLGTGGAIAGLLFFFYRKDVGAYLEQWKGMSVSLLSVVASNTKAMTELTEAVRELKDEATHNRREEDDRRLELGLKTRITDRR